MRVGSHIAQVNYANKTQNIKEKSLNEILFSKKNGKIFQETLNSSGLSEFEKTRASFKLCTAPLHTKAFKLLDEALARGESLETIDIGKIYLKAQNEIKGEYKDEDGLLKAIKEAKELSQNSIKLGGPSYSSFEIFLDKLLEVIEDKSKMSLDIKA